MNYSLPARFLCPWNSSREEYWRVLPFPFPGDLPNPGFKPGSPALQADSLPSKPPRKPHEQQKFISHSSGDYNSKIRVLSAVVAQYVPTLESGSVDLEMYYPQFIQALKAAGIDTVLAEKQAQFNEQYQK